MAQVQWERGCGVAANAGRIDTAETGAIHAPWSSNGRRRVVDVVVATPRRVACAGPFLSWKSADAGAWALCSNLLLVALQIPNEEDREKITHQ